jgi:hypothetical protein
LPIVLIRGAEPEALAFHIPTRPGTSEPSLSTQVDRQIAEITFHSHEFSKLNALMTLKEKQGMTISPALPALNEAVLPMSSAPSNAR